MMINIVVNFSRHSKPRCKLIEFLPNIIWRTHKFNVQSSYAVFHTFLVKLRHKASMHSQHRTVERIKSKLLDHFIKRCVVKLYMFIMHNFIILALSQSFFRIKELKNYSAHLYNLTHEINLKNGWEGETLY